MSQSATINRFILFVLLFVCPATVSAIPLHQYQENLKNAITNLEILQNLAESETYDFEQQRGDKIAFVRTILPAQQTVDFEGETCDVDNSWLHKSLDELEKTVEPSEK